MMLAMTRHPGEHQDPGRVAAEFLGGRIRTARPLQGMSQEQVAFKAGVAVTTYGRIERGATSERSPNPNLRTTAKILLALRLTPLNEGFDHGVSWLPGKDRTPARSAIPGSGRDGRASET